MNPRLSDGQSPYKGDPKYPASNTLSLDHSTSDSRPPIHLNLAIVHNPNQDLTSGIFNGKTLHLPNSTTTFSPFFNCEVKIANGQFPTTKQGVKEVCIDGVLFEDDIDPESRKMIELLGVPCWPIPKLKLRNRIVMMDENTPQIVDWILKERQEAGSEGSATANSS